MNWITALASQLSHFWTRAEFNRDLEDEVELHLEMRTAELEETGLSRADAAAKARREFGSVAQAQENSRDAWQWRWLDQIAMDVRYSLRSFRKNPLFTACVVGLLALGIGADTAVFSLVNQTLLSPPGISHPERIISLRTKYTKLNLDFEATAPPALPALSAKPTTFEHVAAVRGLGFNLSAGQRPERITGAAVSASWFDVFGTGPEAGRFFSPAEDKPNSNRVVVLSHGAWLQLFGGDPGAIGRMLDLDQQRYEIIGISKPDFRQPRFADLWIPLALPPNVLAPQNWFNENLSVFGRMREGVSFAQASSMIQDVAKRALDEAPAGTRPLESGWGLSAMRFSDSNAGDTKAPLLILLGAVSLVLLIACSNIAGLMLARTSTRKHELAMRAALGASRSRLMGQILVESAVLAAAGGLAGLVVAYYGVALLLNLAPEAAVGLNPDINLGMLAFAAVASVVAGVFFGLMPAWQVSGSDPQAAIAAGSRGLVGQTKQRLRSALVVSEVALTLVLLVAAGLLLRSFARLQAIDPGFDPRGVIAASFSLPRAAYGDTGKQAAFFRAVLDRLSQSPAVKSATIARPIPFGGELDAGGFEIEGHKMATGEAIPFAERRWSTPGFLSTLGVQLVRGRFLTDQDRAGSQLVAVIDERLARRFWANEDPLGKRLRPTSDEDWHMIVGVIRHVVQSDLANDKGNGHLYLSLYQHPMTFGVILTKSTADSATATAAIREAVRAADPNLPLFRLTRMEDLVSSSLSVRRFLLILLGLFGGTALMLAAIGIFGIISYSVSQRTREIGIRVVLGAQPVAVVGMVVAPVAGLVGLGIVTGIVASLAGTRLIQDQLFGVSSFDPLTLAAMAGTLLGVSLLACAWPVRKALAVDPITALRCE